MDLDGDGVAADEDCDDQNASIYPSAPELCDELDNNCNGQVDEAAVDMQPFTPDKDEDGHGIRLLQPTMACSAPAGLAPMTEDCNDEDANIYPGNIEICWDGKDNDCDSDTRAECDFLQVMQGDQAQSIYDGTTTLCEVIPDENPVSLACAGASLVILEGPFEPGKYMRPTLLASSFEQPPGGFALADFSGNSSVDLLTLAGDIFEGPLSNIPEPKPFLDMDEANAFFRGHFNDDNELDLVVVYDEVAHVLLAPIQPGSLEGQAVLTITSTSRFSTSIGNLFGDSKADLRVQDSEGARLIDGAARGIVSVADAPLLAGQGITKVLRTSEFEYEYDTAVGNRDELWRGPIDLSNIEASRVGTVDETGVAGQLELLGLVDWASEGTPSVFSAARGQFFVSDTPPEAAFDPTSAITTFKIDDNYLPLQAIYHDLDGDGTPDLLFSKLWSAGGDGVLASRTWIYFGHGQ
ncbi:MAG: putative metal-binding motif-containing protein [Myxococcota bacterium]